ncbi:MAG: Ig-like domain-containing protein, partial [Bacteroidota bacterium]
MKIPFETALYGTFRHLPARSRIPFLLAFFLLNVLMGWGQHVQISSPEPDPTSTSPIPINIKFEDGVDVLTETDFTVSNGNLQNLQRTVPGLQNFESFDLTEFPVTATIWELIANSNNIDEFVGEKIKNAVIAIDYDSNDQLYYLTYGNGVFRYNPGGNDQQIIAPSHFDSPLDMVIDNSDRILVADPKNLKVLVFEGSTFKYEIGGALGSGAGEFYGPTGLAISKNNNLYVADAFTGNDTSGLDQVKVYDLGQNSATLLRRFGDNNLEDPYRIAVDKQNNVYVSDSGGNSDTGRLVVFNSDESFLKFIANSADDSPGDIIVDDYGYLYMVNFMGDLNFSDIYQSPENLISEYQLISTSHYPVDVFTPYPELQFVNDITNFLDLPIDLALDSCGYLAVNNLDLGGSASLSGIDATFDFDVTRFKRQDNFTAEVFPENPGLVEVELSGRDLFKCGPQPQDYFSIEYQESNVNTSPVANDDTYSVDQDVVLIISAPGVLDNDTDAEDDDLTAILEDNPQNGTLSLNSDGSFTYEPNAGYSGPD